MKFIAFADIHFHNFKDFSNRSSRFEIQLAVLDQIIAYAKEHKAHILFAGDLFHKRSYIYAPVFNAVFEKIARSEVRWIMLPGNHDEHATEIHSLESFKCLEHIELLYNTSTFRSGNCSVYGLAPGQKLTTSFQTPSIVLAHGQLYGAKSASGFTFETGYKQEDFSDPNIKLVILGDIHKGQQHGKVWIPGSPMHHDFGDAGDEKSVLLIDDEFNVTRLPIQAPQFRILNTNTFDTYKEQITTGDTRNYYRIELDENATLETENNLREKLVNSIVIRAVENLAKTRTQLKRSQSPRELLSGYHSYANLKVDLETFISEGTKLLTVGGKADDQKTSHTSITFIRVSVENFMSFQKAQLDIKEGVWLVTGRAIGDSTVDTNGIGKSTLLTEAIIYCLYDTLIRSGVKSKDRVIHDPHKTGKGKDCAVSVAVQINGTEYEFIRARKHFKYGTGVTIKCNGKVVEVEDSEKELASIFNLPMEILCNVAIFPQKSLKQTHKPFLQCTDSERKEILEHALALGAFGIAGDRASELLLEVKGKISQLTQNIAVQNNVISSKKQTIENLNNSKVLFEQKRLTDIQATEAELAQISNELSKSSFDQDSWNRAVKRVADTQAQLAHLQSNRPVQAENALQLQRKLVNDITFQLNYLVVANVPSQEELATLREDIATLEHGENELTHQLTKLRISAPENPESEISSIQGRISKLQLDLNKVESEISTATSALESTCTKLLAPLERCYVCGQTVTAEALEKTRAALTLQRDGQQKQLGTIEARKEKLSKELTEERQLLEATKHKAQLYNDYVAKSGELTSKHAAVRQQLTSHRNTLNTHETTVRSHHVVHAKRELLNKSLNEAQQKLPDLANAAVAEQAAYNTALETLSKEYNSALTEQRVLETAMIAMRSCKDKLCSLEAKLAQLQQSKFPFESSIAAELLELEQRTASLAVNEAALVKENANLALYQALLEAFGPQGIVSLILDEFLGDFQAITTKLCNEITMGKIQIRYDTEVTLKKKDATGKNLTKDKFDVIVEKVPGGDGFDLVSGSEQQKANLIIDQALAQLVSQRSAISTNLRVYDEVFDALDNVSTDCVAKTLLAQEPGIAKYIITHSRELAVLLSNKVEILMENGVSSLLS